MSLFFDAYTLNRSAQAVSDASDAKNSAARNESRLDGLERRADRMALACQALWEILRETTGMRDAQIIERMKAIDLRDGREDGKIGSQVLSCPSCGRHVNSQNASCVYCGAKIPAQQIVR